MTINILSARPAPLIPPFLPGSGATLQSWLHPPNGTTLLAALDAQGATPQAVTITSSTSMRQCANIEVQITGTGILGAGTARWRIYGGAWTTFTIQATVAITGTSFTLHFPAGLYTNLDFYRSVFSTLVDHAGNVWNGSSATAAVRPFIGEINGRPTIRGDGTARNLRTTTATLASAMMNGIRTPFTAIFVARFNGPLTADGNTYPLFSLCGGSTFSQAVFYFASTNGNWTSGKRGDTGGTTIVNPGVASDNNPHVFEVMQSGTNLTVAIDGSTVISAAQNVAATCSLQFFEPLAIETQGIPPNNLFSDADYGDHALYTGVLGSTARAYVRQNFKLAYAL